MTDEQRMQIINLREAGNGYKKIGQLLGLSENTVKSFCQRRNLGGVVVQTAADVSVCKCCGKPVQKIPCRGICLWNCKDPCRTRCDRADGNADRADNHQGDTFKPVLHRNDGASEELLHRWSYPQKEQRRTSHVPGG